MTNQDQHDELFFFQSSDHPYHYQHLSQDKNHDQRLENFGIEGLSYQNENSRKRTIIIEKNNSSFGFTLQTYGIHHLKQGEIELLTYVDYVDENGPAFKAGMRPGDVILSINGKDMEDADHRSIVNYIQSCKKTMRIVILFEDCVRKVELHMKYLKLKKSLNQKIVEYEILCERENHLLKNFKSKSLTDNLNQDHSSLVQNNYNSLENILKSISSIYENKPRQELVLNCNLNQNFSSLKFLTKFPKLVSSSSLKNNLVKKFLTSFNCDCKKLTKSFTIDKLPSSHQNDFLTHL